MKSKWIFEHVFVYEEIMRDPALGVTKMFQALNIPLDFIPVALSAFEKHSQNLWSITNDHIELSNDEIARINAIYAKFCVPINQDMSLEDLLKVLN